MHRQRRYLSFRLRNNHASVVLVHLTVTNTHSYRDLTDSGLSAPLQQIGDNKNGSCLTIRVMFASDKLKTKWRPLVKLRRSSARGTLATSR